MKLESLRVFHLSKSTLAETQPAGGGLGVLDDAHLFSLSGDFARVYHFETCQRWVWVFDDGIKMSSLWKQSSQLLKGYEAYRFLLRWATGLESEVLGETDVFGQIKESWRKINQAKNFKESGLSFWMQKVFEDTKDIRTCYLQNLGGSSYGTLVRKWMKDQSDGAGTKSEGPVLLIGAGQLAQAIAPSLLDGELYLQNRDFHRLNIFYESLVQRYPSKKLTKIENKEQEEHIWQDASYILICIPVDEINDLERIKWFQRGCCKTRSIIHLGTRKRDCGAWSVLENFACLDDLFTLQKSISNIRSIQVAKAEKACEERTQLRALGRSLSIPHGWEDLACFA